MDMSGAGKLRIPDRTWVEFRGADGHLIASAYAEDDGAMIRDWLPGFPAGTFGTEQLCSETDGVVWREEAEPPEELPVTLLLSFTQYG